MPVEKNSAKHARREASVNAILSRDGHVETASGLSMGAKAELDKLVKLGVCYSGKSEWASPLLVTTKPCKHPCTCSQEYPCGALVTLSSKIVKKGKIGLNMKMKPA